MGNYDELKQAIAAVIKTNGNQEITGEVMQNALLSIISTVGNYATFAGIATLETNPGTPDQNVFWIASTPGEYVNFGLILVFGEICIFQNKSGQWVKKETGFASIVNSIININAEQNSTDDYTLEQAIELVPQNRRQLGTKIRFRTQTKPSQKWMEATYIAVDVSDVNWKNPSLWVKIEYSGGYDLNIEKTYKNIIYDSIININAEQNNTNNYTLEQALLLVPENQRRLGTKIRFRTSGDPKKWMEATYIAGNADIENWTNLNFWATVEYIIGNNISYKNEIININAEQNSTDDYTLEQAIELVPQNRRQLGTKIRFRTQTNPSQKWMEATYIAGNADIENWTNLNFWATVEYGILKKTKWFALGDSITEGYYSEDGILKGVTPNNYPYYVGIMNNYETTNYGVGGSGYVHNATVGDKLNAKDKVDTINFANCDLVTLAWGVNDWHYNCEIGSLETSTKGDGTMVGNMKYVIEKILDENPKAKIVVILPQNSSAYGGSFETNWGLGSNLPTSGTLQNVIDAEISVCNYYGLQYIDQTKSGIVNRYNIQQLLPDGLHPAKDGYLQMSKYISKQILFE